MTSMLLWIEEITLPSLLVVPGLLPSMRIRSNFDLEIVATSSSPCHLATLSIEAVMHEIRVSNFAVRLNNWQVCTLLFFCLSGMGFIGSGLMLILDIIRWSYWS